ncbi:MAG: hypothetical protein KDK34_01515 [Leptospiraceae bacterium]|nr:hypothetical protein [Leptospiraceae bacterium]MCB1318895.1 hypothetical protein [Leptospiraceae bacterium]
MRTIFRITPTHLLLLTTLSIGLYAAARISGLISYTDFMIVPHQADRTHVLYGCLYMLAHVQFFALAPVWAFCTLSLYCWNRLSPPCKAEAVKAQHRNTNEK